MSIRCGHCQSIHDTALQVRECYGGVNSAASFLGTTVAPPATEKQINYAQALLREREAPEGSLAYGLEDNAAAERVNSATKPELQRFISELLDSPRRSTPQKTATVQVGEGFYRHKENNCVYKVVRAVHGSGHLYAKILEKDGHWEMAPGKLSTLRPDEKMSKEEVGEYGKLYGICMICGRTLTDEFSIANGIGPVCAAKRGMFR